MNKDLILREKLAIARTKMAIERTFLSYIRTALYFLIAGMTINQISKWNYSWIFEVLFWVLSFLILSFGTYQAIKHKKKLKESEKQIGNYILEYSEE